MRHVTRIGLALAVLAVGAAPPSACDRGPAEQPPTASPPVVRPRPRPATAPRRVAPPRRPVARKYLRHHKALVGGTVVATRLPGLRENVTVLIKGDRIVRIGPVDKVQIPPQADVIDVRGKYLVPGLIDGHIHFFQSGGLYTRPDGLDLRHRVPYADELRWIRENMDDLFRRYIRSGVTTVVDVGGPMWNFDVRAQARRTRAAPRAFVAGPLIASYQPAALTTKDPPIIRVDTVPRALALVRQQVKAKTDLIKIWYVASKKLVDKGLAVHPDKFYRIVQAVVRESHKHGLPVYVHATELEVARRAITAGADVLVHSVRDREVDADFLKLARDKGVVYVPTLWVFNSYAAVYSKQLALLPVEHRLGNPKVIGSLFDMHELKSTELGERHKKLQQDRAPIVPSPVILRNLKKVHDAGITVALGTDAGNVGVLHGPSVFHDLALMKRAGLGNAFVLKAATWGGARMLRREKDLGSLEAGKLADLLVLDSNPIADLKALQTPRLVLKGGQVLVPDEVLVDTPADLAQRQLNAYNARDLEAFLAVYAPDVELYTFPGTLLYKGRDQMRRRYGAFFDNAKTLHCRLLSRITQGRYVIDRELVATGIPGREHLQATAIYEVSGGLIQKVWFLK